MTTVLKQGNVTVQAAEVAKLEAQEAAASDEILTDTTKKEEEISRFEQIYNALKAAILLAKAADAENEGAFSCDVKFDVDGTVEYAEVCFYEYFNYFVMYNKDTETKKNVDALFEPGSVDHDKEVWMIARTVLNFYEERLAQAAEEEKEEAYNKQIREEYDMQAKEEEREYREIFG